MERQAGYEQHRSEQRDFILDAAAALFVERGIDAVSFSTVAASCKMTRSTLYRYFQDKQTLLWAISQRLLGRIGDGMKRRAGNGSAFQRFRAYLEEFYQSFEENPDFLRFFGEFEDVYQEETARRGGEGYQKAFKPGDFGSGDTVRFLTEKFSDGSIRAGLDPTETAVAVTYAGIHAVVGLSKDRDVLALKYGVEAKRLVRLTFDMILHGLQSEIASA